MFNENTQSINEPSYKYRSALIHFKSNKLGRQQKATAIC